MVAYFCGIIVSGVLGAEQRAAKRTFSAACFGGIVVNGALGAERRTVRLASTVTCFYGVIVSGVLGAGRRAARQASTVACFYAIVFNGALGAVAHGQACVHGGLLLRHHVATMARAVWADEDNVDGEAKRRF